MALVVAAGGCAQQGDFPSLLPRPIEQGVTEAPEPVPVPDGPVDAALAARLAVLVAQAREGQAAFEEQLGPTRAAVASAGAAASESWIEAQVALSRLQSARTPTMTSLGELDVLAAERSRMAETSAADRAAIGAALEQVEGLALAQTAAINALNGAMATS